jgi:hypothetical protein
MTCPSPFGFMRQLPDGRSARVLRVAPCDPPETTTVASAPPPPQPSSMAVTEIPLKLNRNRLRQTGRRTGSPYGVIEINR